MELLLKSLYVQIKLLYKKPKEKSYLNGFSIALSGVFMVSMAWMREGPLYQLINSSVLLFSVRFSPVKPLKKNNAMKYEHYDIKNQEVSENSSWNNL